MSAPEIRQPPEVGTLVHDTSADKVGEYRGTAGARWTLRPPGGGIEWEVTPDAVEPAGTYEHLRALTAEENATRKANRL